MNGYTKLFSRILDSTIWREEDPTRILWITMLALADRDGIVHSTIPGLADRARISIADCETALDRFQQPDKYSWSKDDEGRRIRVVDGGWFLISHAKYRALMSKEDQREKTRLRVEKFRAKKRIVTNGNACNDKQKQKQKHIQKQLKSKALCASRTFARPTIEEVSNYCRERKNVVDPILWLDHYESNGWRVGKSPMKDWKAAVRTWEKNDIQGGKQNARLSAIDEFARKHGIVR